MRVTGARLLLRLPQSGNGGFFLRQMRVKRRHQHFRRLIFHAPEACDDPRRPGLHERLMQRDHVIPPIPCADAGLTAAQHDEFRAAQI